MMMDGRSGTHRADPPIDEPGLLERCMGNHTLLRMLLEKFDAQARGDLAALSDALRARDARVASLRAHSLKGAAGAVTAPGVLRAAASLEAFVRSADWAGADGALVSLRGEVDRALAHITARRAA